MATFLTKQWIEELNANLEKSGASALLSNLGDSTFAIQYRVKLADGTPFNYHLVVSKDHLKFDIGESPYPSPTLNMDYETAKLLIKGELSVDNALNSGKIKISGDPKLLLEASGVLGILQDSLNTVTLTTTYKELEDHPMEILSSRVLLRPADLERSLKFYRDDLGLAIYREFGEGNERGVVFFLGGGYLEISGKSGTLAGPNLSLWLQVRDVERAYKYLEEKSVLVTRGPKLEPWGLKEMWVSDPDGVRLYIVEVPENHPIRRPLVQIREERN